MKKMEVNAGEMFGVSDKVILCRESESVIALGSKIGAEQEQIFYMFTFSGKLNNKDRTGEVTVLMSIEDAFQHANQIIEGITAVLESNGLIPPDKSAEDDVPPPLDLDVPEYDYTQHSSGDDDGNSDI